MPVQDGHRWGWDGRTGDLSERWVREGWATQDSPGVPTVADAERESGGGQAGAVLRGRGEQEDHSAKSAGQGEGPQAQRGARAGGCGGAPSLLILPGGTLTQRKSSAPCLRRMVTATSIPAQGKAGGQVALGGRGVCPVGEGAELPRSGLVCPIAAAA